MQQIPQRLAGAHQFMPFVERDLKMNQQRQRGTFMVKCQLATEEGECLGKIFFGDIPLS